MRNIVVGSFLGFVLAAAFLAACGGGSGASSQAIVGELEAEVARLEADVARCLDLLTHFSRGGNDVCVTGANLHVVNGLSATETSNGLGNLVVGYNEQRVDDGVPQTDDTNDRTGSHMVVVGSGLNYAAYGGIVVGERSSTEGGYASVSGGRDNIARGAHASVSGGYLREITGGTANQYLWRAGNVFPTK